MNSQQGQKLEREVRQYLSTHVYKGYCESWELGFLSRNTLSRGISVHPKGFEEEEISTSDPEWERGLAEIGEKFGVALRLPYYLFRK